MPILVYLPDRCGTLGQRLKYWRMARNMTIRTLATTLQIRHATVNRYEADALIPDIPRLRALGRALDIPWKVLVPDLDSYVDRDSVSLFPDTGSGKP